MDHRLVNYKVSTCNQTPFNSEKPGLFSTVTELLIVLWCLFFCAAVVSEFVAILFDMITGVR